MDYEKLIVDGLLTLLLAWMIYYLVRVFLDFREENLKIVRKENVDIATDLPNINENQISKSSEAKPSEEERHAPILNDEVQGKDLDEDDWEGVETSVLEDTFNDAAILVASSVVGRGTKLTQDLQLQLYGLYKQATEGPCKDNAPSVFNLKAKAKWDAWQKLGEMSSEEAMLHYISKTQDTFGISLSGDDKMKNEMGGLGTSGMGPIFSYPVMDEETEGSSPKGLHAFARDGHLQKAQMWIQEGGNVNETDDEGRTAVHWAVDRGHLEVLKTLAASGADLNIADVDGQTPLHYAVACEYKDIVEELLHQGSDPDVKDKDGTTPRSLMPKTWQWAST